MTLAGSASNYIEAGTKADYTTALTDADAFFTANAAAEYYVVSIGTDVVVFVDNASTGTALDAIVLVGRTLADISEANII